MLHKCLLSIKGRTCNPTPRVWYTKTLQRKQPVMTIIKDILELRLSVLFQST